MLALLLPAPAAAQDALWIPEPAQTGTAWYAAARTALEGEDVVVREGDETGGACALQSCALERAKQLGLQVALAVQIEPGSAGGAERASVRAERVDGRSARGEATIAGGDVGAALRAAYRQAELGLELGEQGLLRVESTPQAALVALDGEPIGSAPLEQRLSPGQHRLAFSLDGFASQQREVEVTRGRATDLRVQLARVAAAPPPVRRARSALNYIVGGALLLGAAPALAVSISTLALDGDCAVARDSSGHCAQVVHFGAPSAVLLGLGSAALIAGGYFLIAAPIRVEVRAGPHALQVGARVRF